jgi:hypothetical protein
MRWQQRISSTYWQRACIRHCDHNYPLTGVHWVACDRKGMVLAGADAMQPLLVLKHEQRLPCRCCAAVLALSASMCWHVTSASRLQSSGCAGNISHVAVHSTTLGSISTLILTCAPHPLAPQAPALGPVPPGEGPALPAGQGPPAEGGLGAGL